MPPPSKALLFTFLVPILLLPSPTHQTLNPRLLDQLIKDSSIPSFPCRHKTSRLYRIHLPSNLSSVSAHVSTFRADSLRRHGARIEQLTISPGSIFIHPHVKRLLIVHQNLNKLSYIYNTENISGYDLASPVLGLLVYPPHLHVKIRRRPITINFTGTVPRVLDSSRSVCAAFQLDGNVSLSSLLDGYVCEARSQGHYAILARSSSSSSRGEVEVDAWKVAVMSCVGGGFGAVMVGMVAVAVAKGRREKARVEEMERREYEEEVLRVAMVGHVRAPVAVGARTAPVLESEVVYDCDPSLL